MNENIPKDSFSVVFAKFYDAVELLHSLGPGTLMGKIDIKHAFRICPVWLADILLLGTFWQGLILLNYVYLSTFAAQYFSLTPLLMQQVHVQNFFWRGGGWQAVSLVFKPPSPLPPDIFGNFRYELSHPLSVFQKY